MDARIQQHMQTGTVPIRSAHEADLLDQDLMARLRDWDARAGTSGQAKSRRDLLRMQLRNDLSQLLNAPELADLPADLRPHHVPVPPEGSRKLASARQVGSEDQPPGSRQQRPQPEAGSGVTTNRCIPFRPQAHALSLAEAGGGTISRWWKHLGAGVGPDQSDDLELRRADEALMTWRGQWQARAKALLDHADQLEVS